MSAFDKWICVFPGKMGITWKIAYPYTIYSNVEEALQAAKQNCNVIAIPLVLYEKFKDIEKRMMLAENKIQKIKFNIKIALDKILAQNEIDAE